MFAACPEGQNSFGGTCVTSCPISTFQTPRGCQSCHPDCASCNGPNFNQCISCSPSSKIPALINGRCLTCQQSQFFDKVSSTCKSCDPSCSSCSGAGPNNCQACSSPSQSLQAGTCVNANCTSQIVIPGLGVCLEQLVSVNPNTPTSLAQATLVGKTTSTTSTITSSPTPATTSLAAQSHLQDQTKSHNSSQPALQPWLIALIVLGSLFVLLMALMSWRRRIARRKRAQRASVPSENWRYAIGDLEY